MNCLLYITWKMYWIKVSLKAIQKHMISSGVVYSIQVCNEISEPPVGSSISVLICSDDHLLELNITRVDHIIHFDLPDNFEAFSFRYSVFMRSHSILRVHISNWFNLTCSRRNLRHFSVHPVWSEFLVWSLFRMNYFPKVNLIS